MNYLFYQFLQDREECALQYRLNCVKRETGAKKETEEQRQQEVIHTNMQYTDRRGQVNHRSTCTNPIRILIQKINMYQSNTDPDPEDQHVPIQSNADPHPEDQHVPNTARKIKRNWQTKMNLNNKFCERYKQ